MMKMPKTMTLAVVGDLTVCSSYNTPVAAFVPGVGYIKTDKKYSVTTSKHANMFCRNGGTNGKTVEHAEFLRLITLPTAYERHVESFRNGTQEKW